MIKILILLSCFSAPLQAAWLALCDSPLQPPSPGDSRFSTADGSVKTLRFSEKKPSDACSLTELPVPADALLWFAPLSADQALQIGQSPALVLQGRQNGKHFAGEVSLDSGAAAPIKPLPWPLYLDLQEHLDIGTFGLEERASLARSKTGTLFRCRAGQQPAGFVLSVGQALLPQLPRLSLSLELQGLGDFIWAASRTGSDRDPQPLAKMRLGSRQRSENIDLAPMLQPQNDWDSWILLCPQTEAELTLSAMQLTAQASAPRGRATWIWREAHWRQADAELWRKLGELRITTLYITVPLSADLTRVADISALQSFIAEAGRRGIGVWAVAGDPQAVLASERESWLRRAKAYADYNRDVAESARLKGVQYDIEPYLAPGYAQAPEVWKQAYIDTLAALRKASTLPLEVAVPVWWAEQTLNDQPILEAMAAWVNGVTVMDYRTDPWRIQQQALAFLDWGARHGKTIRIALEAGPVAEETRLAFRRAEVGNLWVARVGDVSLLLHLATPGVNAAGETFNLTRESTVSGEAVSFHGQADALANCLPQLERALGAWPMFTGLALHEILAP